MYCSDHFKQVDDETFTLRIPKDEDFRILQLTDLHLGFGPLSRRMDRLAQRIQSIRTPIDLIIMDPVETAEKPAAFAVHIGIQQNQWQKDLSGIVDQCDRNVIYRHGSIAEKDEYFGISKFKSTFFDRAAENGVIKWIFCGHDHMNTLSLVYRGIQMTYGMSPISTFPSALLVISVPPLWILLLLIF